MWLGQRSGGRRSGKLVAALLMDDARDVLAETMRGDDDVDVEDEGLAEEAKTVGTVAALEDDRV